MTTIMRVGSVDVARAVAKGLRAQQAAAKAYTLAARRDSNRYVPMLSGALRGSAGTQSDIYGGRLTYGGGKAVAPASNSGAGTYRFKTTVNIRTGAGTGYRVVGQYKAGSTVRISRVVTAGGYRWGVYTAYSGHTRYVALGVVGGKSYAA